MRGGGFRFRPQSIVRWPGRQRQLQPEAAVPDSTTLRTFITALHYAVAKSKSARLLIGVVAAACVWVGAIAWVERPRMMEGTWINLFEGSKFFEGAAINEACSPAFDRAPWLSFYPSPNSKIRHDLDTATRTRPGEFISPHGSWPLTAYRMKFVGRKQIGAFFGLAPLLGIGYGHLSASGSEIIVDRLMAIEEIPAVRCDIR